MIIAISKVPSVVWRVGSAIARTLVAMVLGEFSSLNLTVMIMIVMIVMS
jgi:hypothetical protein